MRDVSLISNIRFQSSTHRLPNARPLLQCNIYSPETLNVNAADDCGSRCFAGRRGERRSTEPTLAKYRATSSAVVLLFSAATICLAALFSPPFVCCSQNSIWLCVILNESSHCTGIKLTSSFSNASILSQLSFFHLKQQLTEWLDLRQLLFCNLVDNNDLLKLGILESRDFVYFFQ